MTCRACGREERASEGYPCADCGTFICLICTMRGVVFCRTCEPKHPGLQQLEGERARQGQDPGPGA